MDSVSNCIFSLYKSNSNWFSFWAFNNCTREDNWLIFYTSEQKDSLCKQDSKLKNFLKSLNVHINFMFRTNILRNTKHCTILFCDMCPNLFLAFILVLLLINIYETIAKLYLYGLFQNTFEILRLLKPFLDH